MNSEDSWTLLIVSLPTSGATARMRIWRTVRALGCAALRDGAYLLPGGHAQCVTLQELADETRQQGGQAWLLDVRPQDPDEHAACLALFDRSADYADWQATLSDARKTLSGLGSAELARLLRRHGRAYDAIRKVDFFPNDASVQAEAQWKDFSAAIETLRSPGEPRGAAGNVPRRDRSGYQGRLWATRRRLWVDRVACAWLIRRFIDPHASFLWIDAPADCPADALGFDFDGATFTHVGDLVSFEVLLASFGLDGDPALHRLGTVIHALDIGGPAVPEASGFEAVLAGARERHTSDDTLLAEISLVLDSLYAHFSASARR
ncbi:chromate resistance protein ChrB domain-containing protein [Cupriavidus numazuensis]|uniref:Protein ChrB n=1 Tax=Cupriavidus numazuensis TaxID=221992 RepID=A0ABM8TM57_9BURK|nr:chromate resistance protein ChrB domain-containing protein [Cupriavidus numazuensis]CAG2154610.1 Protein ChrB [Cupriavidus numazuensis]